MSLGIEKLNSVNNKKITKTLLADGKIDQSLHDFLNTPDKETKWKYWSTTFTVYLGFLLLVSGFLQIICVCIYKP